MNKALFALILAAVGATAFAKLPPPSDEANAKAAEAAAKTAHTAKVDAYLLCKSQDKVAAHVQRTNKAKAGKAEPTPPCSDPGKFVYTPPEAATSAPSASASAPTVAAAPSKAVSPVAPAKK
jgi:hypothetical protein